MKKLKYNTMTKEKFVTTIKNEELPISKTRKYNRGYYKIGNVEVENSGDCYLMDDGKYYRAETEHIVYNHTKNRYVFINSFNLAQGYINENLDIGYFDFNISKNVIIHTKENKKVLGIDESIIQNNLEYRERLETGEYYHIDNISAKMVNLKRSPLKEYKYSLTYNSKNVLDDYIKSYNQNKKPINNKYPQLNNLFGNFSFGLEFETIKGKIPDRHLGVNGLIPLRDGSILGIEYATIPFFGIEAISAVNNVCNVLDKYTGYDNSCSLHLHIGNIPRTESFILAFMKVFINIQDELYSLFPLYKKYNFNYKNKNYTAPYNPIKFKYLLDSFKTENDIKSGFARFFEYLTNGFPYSEVNHNLDNVTHHPKDSSGEHKWYVGPRYHICNVIPLIFGNKKTIEFRLHTPTFDNNKIISFMILNICLLKYCVVNENTILKKESYNNLTLRHIINSFITPENASLLYGVLDYIEHRSMQVENFNLNSDIFFEESDIHINNIFNTSQKDSFNIKKVSKTPIPRKIKRGKLEGGMSKGKSTKGIFSQIRTYNMDMKNHYSEISEMGKKYEPDKMESQHPVHIDKF